MTVTAPATDQDVSDRTAAGPVPEPVVRRAWLVYHPRPSLDKLRGRLAQAARATAPLPGTIPVRLEVRYFIDVDVPAKSKISRRLHHLSAPSAPLLARRCMDVLSVCKIIRPGQVVAVIAAKAVVHNASPDNASEHGPSYLDVRLVEVDNPTTSVPVFMDRLYDWYYNLCDGNVSYHEFLKVSKTLRASQRADRLFAKRHAAAASNGGGAPSVEVVAAQLAPLAKKLPATAGPAPKQSAAEKAAALGPMMQKPKPAQPK